MIPTRATDAQHAQYVANIIAQYVAATPEQIRLGRNWYITAHGIAEQVSEGDAVRGAGVIAALSANKAWTENVKLTRRAFVDTVPTGHVRNALDKAAKIMAGVRPEDVLPMGAKTGMFYRCILDPSDPDAVVIDRHAHDIATGEVLGNAERGLSNPTRYATLAHAYREAARKLGEVPSVVQAITWVVQTQSLRGVGTRGHNH